MTNVFISIALIAVIWFTVTSIIICNWLSKRSYKVNYLFIRFFLPVYVNQYKTITKSETGKPGALFYHWIISINIALAFGIAAFVSKI
jgi:hypothetical protein